MCEGPDENGDLLGTGSPGDPTRRPTWLEICTTDSPASYLVIRPEDWND
jgi:hypothetical protein